MVQECFQNLQVKTFNNHVHVVHFLLCRAEAKEISLLIFTNRVLLWSLRGQAIISDQNGCL